MARPCFVTAQLGRYPHWEWVEEGEVGLRERRRWGGAGIVCARSETERVAQREFLARSSFGEAAALVAGGV